MRIYSILRLLLVCCLSLLALAPAAQAAPIDRIVAVVNDEVITSWDLQQRLFLEVARLKRQNVSLPSTDNLKRQLLDRMIAERLQLQQARDTNITVDDATLQKALETIAANNRLSLDELHNAVEKQEGVPWSRFREDIRKEVILSRLRDRDINSKIMVSDAEIDAFLNSPEGKLSGHEYLVSYIFLRAPPNSSFEQWAQLGKRADEVQSAIARGEDFAKLSATFSDAKNAMTGGSLDWQPIERLPSILAEKLLTMKPGQVSETMRTPTGLHIFKLVNVRDKNSQSKQAQQTHARHILVRTSDIVSSEDAQKRLNTLRDRILGGADFAELARTNSADTGSATKGGDLGWVAQGVTVPDFENAMNALKPGEISQPIQTPFGWHIIQVLERRTVDVSAEKRRAEALDAIRNRKADEAFEDWVRQLRDSAYVDIRLDKQE